LRTQQANKVVKTDPCSPLGKRRLSFQSTELAGEGESSSSEHSSEESGSTGPVAKHCEHGHSESSGSSSSSRSGRKSRSSCGQRSRSGSAARSLAISVPTKLQSPASWILRPSSVEQPPPTIARASAACALQAPCAAPARQLMPRRREVTCVSQSLTTTSTSASPSTLITPGRKRSFWEDVPDVTLLTPAKVIRGSSTSSTPMEWPCGLKSCIGIQRESTSPTMPKNLQPAMVPATPSSILGFATPCPTKVPSAKSAACSPPILALKCSSQEIIHPATSSLASTPRPKVHPTFSPQSPRTPADVELDMQEAPEPGSVPECCGTGGIAGGGIAGGGRDVLALLRFTGWNIGRAMRLQRLGVRAEGTKASLSWLPPFVRRSTSDPEGQPESPQQHMAVRIPTGPRATMSTPAPTDAGRDRLAPALPWEEVVHIF